MREAIRDFMAELLTRSVRRIRREAIGWLFVAVDEESGKHVYAVGLFETPEEARIAAQAAATEDMRHLGPDERGWQHHVLPLFPP